MNFYTELSKKIYFLTCAFIFIFVIFILSLVFLLQEKEDINTYSYSDELVQRRAHQRIEISIER